MAKIIYKQQFVRFFLKKCINSRTAEQDENVAFGVHMI